VFFGCNTSIAQSHKGLDGVFRFGRQSFSVNNQLYSQGFAPEAFSQCLDGNSSVTIGGYLVIVTHVSRT
nr:aspartic proteinase-like protein 2 [Tanacetum cinerariifolium]